MSVDLVHALNPACITRMRTRQEILHAQYLSPGLDVGRFLRQAPEMQEYPEDIV